jgi:hypothetical protein
MRLIDNRGVIVAEPRRSPAAIAPPASTESYTNISKVHRHATDISMPRARLLEAESGRIQAPV